MTPSICNARKMRDENEMEGERESRSTSIATRGETRISFITTGDVKT